MSDMKTLSIYIHIPFCEHKCNYCNFLSYKTDNITINQYIKALILEINMYRGLMDEYVVNTIFIGGGTPSLILSKDMEIIIAQLRQVFNIKKNAEITIEMNPGTVSLDKLKNYKSMGINRLSIGLQSIEDKQLNLLGRVHNYYDFLTTYNNARKVEFDNINIDLMMALPNQKREDWIKSLKKIVKLDPEHISCYSLTIEEETLFYKWYQNGYLNCPNEDVERNMFKDTVEQLKKDKYEHYEISNFSKINYKCNHNLTYWKVNEYLGIGLGSASYLDSTRFRNTYNLNYYLLESNKKQNIREDIIILTQKQKMEEFMFLGLRLINGVSKKEFKLRFNVAIEKIYENVLTDLLEKHLIEINNDIIKLTLRGIDISNYVFLKFLFD